MLLLRGVNSLYPCLICLVPDHAQSNLRKTWRMRTVEEAQVAVDIKRVGARDDATKDLGIRPTKVCMQKIYKL